MARPVSLTGSSLAKWFGEAIITQVNRAFCLGMLRSTELHSSAHYAAMPQPLEIG